MNLRLFLLLSGLCLVDACNKRLTGRICKIIERLPESTKNSIYDNIPDSLIEKFMDKALSDVTKGFGIPAASEATKAPEVAKASEVAKAPEASEETCYQCGKAKKTREVLYINNFKL